MFLFNSLVITSLVPGGLTKLPRLLTDIALGMLGGLDPTGNVGRLKMTPPV